MFTRTGRMLCAALLAVVAVAVVALVTGWTDTATLHHLIANASAGGGIALAGFPVVARTYEDLGRIGRPLAATEPEAIPGILFDTLTWTAAGVPAGLKFYQQANPADNASNVQNGRLPAGWAFQVYSFKCDLLRVPTFTGNTQAGALNDIELLLKANQTYFIFSQNSKPWQPIPLTAAHATGGATGFMAASYTAPQVMQYGNNGVFDDGFTTDGSLVILPQVPFSVFVQGIQPASALAADLVIRFCMVGTWYRPVS